MKINNDMFWNDYKMMWAGICFTLLLLINFNIFSGFLRYFFAILLGIIIALGLLYKSSRTEGETKCT